MRCVDDDVTVQGYEMPVDCYDTDPPLAVKIAASFLQPVMGSGGVLQFSYYAMFGYPGSVSKQA